MTASAAAGSAAAGGAAAPVPLPVRPPRPLSARPLAAVGCGLAEAGRRPAAAGEGWGRCRFPYPAALCSGPKRAGGGGGAGPRGGSEPGQAAFVAPASRSVAAKPPGGTAQSSSCPGCSSRQRARALRCTVPAGEAQPHRHAHVFGVLLT